MAAYPNCIIFVFVTIILQVLCTVCVGAITARVHPNDIQITVGSTVTLACAVDDIGVHSVYWYRHTTQTYLTKDTKVFHQAGSLRSFYQRITVVGDRNQGEFNLKITNVSFEDADRFSCVFFDRSRYVGESQSAELKVYEAPAEGFPICDITPLRGVGPGTRVTIQCLSKRSTGAPNSRLDWHRWFEMLPGSFIQGNDPKASYATELTAQDNGAVFTCVESSPVLDVPRTCHVTPFLIPTNVTVIALQGNYHASKRNSKKKTNASIAAGQEALFSCEVEAIPPATNYTWFVDGELAKESPEIRIENNGAHLRLKDVQLTDNGTVIKCKAWNSVLIEGSGQTVLEVERFIRSAQTASSHSFPPSNIAYIIGTVGLIILISFVIFIVLRLRNKKLANRRGSDSREANREHIRQVTPFISEPISEPQAMTVTTAEEVSNAESDESEPFHGVTICSTPHAAIVEHLRETHVTEEGADSNNGPQEDTASRVIMVGRLSSSAPPESPKYKEQHHHNHDTETDAPTSNPVYTKPLKRGKKSKARRGLLKSDISFPISVSSETDSIYMNCTPNANSVHL